MAPPTKVPDKNTLERWAKKGYTQQQMVQMVKEQYGYTISRSTIANAMVRYGLSERGNRYDREIPWRINALHATAHPLRMLRLLGRRNADLELNEHENRILDSWLDKLKRDRIIVAYDPDDDQGFYYIPAEHKDHRSPVPIRKQRLYVAASATRHVRNS